MARPKLMRGMTPMELMRRAEVNAATASVPSVFRAAWMMMTPMAMTEVWKPMGRPVRRRRQLRARPRWRKSPLVKWSHGTLKTIKPAHSRADMPWESTVARAAPPTPMPNDRIKSRSRKMLSVQAMMRKKSGDRLSPRAVMVLERILKSRVTPTPHMVISR